METVAASSSLRSSDLSVCLWVETSDVCKWRSHVEHLCGSVTSSFLPPRPNNVFLHPLWGASFLALMLLCNHSVSPPWTAWLQRGRRSHRDISVCVFLCVFVLNCVCVCVCVCVCGSQCGFCGIWESSCIVFVVRLQVKHWLSAAVKEALCNRFVAIADNYLIVTSNNETLAVCLSGRFVEGACEEHSWLIWSSLADDSASMLSDVELKPEVINSLKY